MFKHVVTYGLSNIFARAASFILLPLYAFYLTPEEFGTATLIWTIITGGSVIALGNLESAVLRFKDDQKSILGLAAKLTDTFGLCGFALSILIGFLTSQTKGFLSFMIIVIILFDSFVAVGLNYLRSIENSKSYATVRIVYIVTLIVATFILVRVDNGKIVAILLSQLIASVVTFGWLLRNIDNTMFDSYSKNDIKKYFRYSLPIAVTVFLFMALDFLDRWFIELYMTRSDVGFYGAIYRLGMIVSVIVTTSQLAWTPFALKNYDKPKLLGKWQTYANFAYAGACFTTVFILPWLITKFNLLPNSYREYFNLLVPVALAYWIFGVGQAQAATLLHYKKTEWLTLAAGLAIVVNIGLNILLIPKQGLLGAANATLVAYAVYTIAVFVLSYKISIVRYNWQLLSGLWITAGYFLWLV